MCAMAEDMSRRMMLNPSGSIRASAQHDFYNNLNADRHDFILAVALHHHIVVSSRVFSEPSERGGDRGVEKPWKQQGKLLSGEFLGAVQRYMMLLS